MTKKIFALILGLSYLFMACDDDNDKSGMFAGKEELLLKKYPQASNISWKKSDDRKYDVATFVLPKVSAGGVDQVSVWFGSDDQIRLVEQELAYRELPENIRLSFEGTKCNPVKGISNPALLNTLYSDVQVWKMDDVYRLERDGVLSYKIEVESVGRGEVEVSLYYDSQGLLLKEVEDIGDAAEMPFEIPAYIKSWVDANHANAEVMGYDVERENGAIEHELDLKVGKVIVEITLLERNGVLELKEEEHRYPDVNALPADIKAEVESAIAAQSAVAVGNIEDIEMVKRGGIEYYVIEFEKGRDEYELKVTRNVDGMITTGKIVRES